MIRSLDLQTKSFYYLLRYLCNRLMEEVPYKGMPCNSPFVVILDVVIVKNRTETCPLRSSGLDNLLFRFRFLNLMTLWHSAVTQNCLYVTCSLVACSAMLVRYRLTSQQISIWSVRRKPLSLVSSSSLNIVLRFCRSSS